MAAKLVVVAAFFVLLWFIFDESGERRERAACRAEAGPWQGASPSTKQNRDDVIIECLLERGNDLQPSNPSDVVFLKLGTLEWIWTPCSI
eukprot:scaffold13793_cov165-Amphora_coffeaeformis.AAC.1